MLARPTHEIGQFGGARRGARKQDRAAIIAAADAVGIAVEQRPLGADEALVIDQQAVAVILQRLAVGARQDEAPAVGVIGDSRRDQPETLAGDRKSVV